MKATIVIGVIAVAAAGYGAYRFMSSPAAPAATPAAGEPAAVTERTGAAVKEIGEGDFQKEVLASDLPVVVDFYATWCGPCRMLAPIMDGVAKSYAGRVKSIRIDVDEARKLAEQYAIQSIPTLIFFKGGKMVDTMIGLPSEEALRAKYDAVAAAPTAAK